MVLIIYRALNPRWSQSVLKLKRLNLKEQIVKRYASSNKISELRQDPESSIGEKRKPSKPPFVKNLFMGVFDIDVLIYPELLSIEDLNLLNRSLEPIKQYFKDKVNSKEIDAKAKLPEEVIKQLKSFNLCGLRIPKEYGGQDISATEYARYCEVTAADSSVSLLLAAHQSLAVQSILLAGSKEQKQKYLPKLASGEWLATFCISENISGSDVASIETTAEKFSDDSDPWLLNGNKLWVTNGANANVFTVLAQTTSKTQFGDAKGVSAFIIEKDYPGVTINKPTNMIGIKGVGVNEVTLKNVEVTPANLLGEEGSGFKLAIDMLTNNRFIAGANTVALLKTLLGLITEHVIHRKQYNTKLMNCEQVQKYCTEIALTIYTLESMTYLTTGLLDSFHNYDGSVENSIVKAFAMEQGQKCIDICLSLLGARGCMEDLPYERYSRDFRTMSIFDGTLDITKLYICTMGLLHSSVYLNETVKKIRNPFDYSGFIFKRLFSERSHANDNPKLNLELYLQLHPSLTGAAKQLEYCVLRLEYAVTNLFTRYGADVTNHQLDLMRLASIVIDVYAMTAVLGRASRAYCTGLAHADYEVLLAQKYCLDAFWRVKENVTNIVTGTEQSGDVYYFKIVENVFQNHGYFLEHPTNRNI